MSRVSDRAWAVADATEGVQLVLHERAVEEVQDCEPHLDYAKHLQSIPHNRQANFRHQAHIPNIWLNKWFHEELERGNVGLTLHGRQFWEEVVQKKLQDPEHKWMLAGPTGTAYKQGHNF